MTFVSMTTHPSPSTSPGSSSMSCRTMVGGVNLEMGDGTDGATLAMEVFFPLTSCPERDVFRHDSREMTGNDGQADDHVTKGPIQTPAEDQEASWEVVCRFSVFGSGL